MYVKSSYVDKYLLVWVEETDTSSAQAHQYTKVMAKKAAKVVNQTSVWKIVNKFCQRSLSWCGRRTRNVNDICKWKLQLLLEIELQ